MSRRVLCAIALALGLLCAPGWADSALAERRVALIVGNSAYQNAPALPNPAKDAKSVAAMFQKAGYDVVSTAYDVGNLDFKRAIRQFEDAASDSDIAVVYYAGHGIEIHGTNYVIPIDAKLASDRDADDEAISLDRLLESVDGAKRLRVIILDACRDNPFARTMKQQRVAALRGVNPGLTAAEPSSINTLIAYAAKAGSEAQDGDGDHSPFAAALVNNLFVPGLDIRLAFGRVRDEVLKKTANRQEPFVYGSLGGGNIALVPAPEQPAATNDLQGEQSDYSLVEKIGTKGAWQVFLTQHPSGFYSDLARQQIAKLSMADAMAAAPGAGTPQPTLVAIGPSKPSTAPAQNTPAAATPAQGAQQTSTLAMLEPPKPPTPPGQTEEQRAWDKIKDSSDAADYRAFIKKYPTSVLADVAQAHAQAIERAAQEQAAKAQAERDAAAAAAAAKAQAERDAAAAAAKAQAERDAAAAAKAQAQRDAAAAAAAAAEAQRQAQLAEAKRQADEAARQKAEQAAALAAAQQAAKAAAQAQQAAEREAALKRDEEAHQAALAEAARVAKQQADAAAAKKQAEQDAANAAAQKTAKAAADQARLDAERAAQAQEAAKKQAEQAAALAAAQQAAKAAEQARLDAQRAAQAQQDAVCKTEQDRLTAMQAEGAKGRADLKQLQQGLTCEKLRPMVTAALDKANALPDVNTPDQIHAAQQQLARLGCYSGAIDGTLSPATTAAVQHYQSERGKPTGAVDVTDALVSDLKDQSARVCPLVCPADKVADGDQCVAVAKPTPVAHQKDDDKPAPTQKAEQKPAKAQEKPAPHQQAKREEPKSAPQPHVVQQASSGGHSSTAIGVGF